MKVMKDNVVYLNDNNKDIQKVETLCFTDEFWELVKKNLRSYIKSDGKIVNLVDKSREGILDFALVQSWRDVKAVMGTEEVEEIDYKDRKFFLYRGGKNAEKG